MVDGKQELQALILHVFLMGYVFILGEFKKVGGYKVMKAREIDAVSTNHLPLTMTGFTPAQIIWPILDVFLIEMSLCAE